MDLISIVACIVGLAFAFSACNWFNLRGRDEAIGTLIFSIIVMMLISAPFVVANLDGDVKYVTSQHKKLVELIDDKKTYEYTCDVKLMYHIPYTVGMYDKSQHLQLFDKRCFNLSDSEYAHIKKEATKYKNNLLGNLTEN